SDMGTGISRVMRAFCSQAVAAAADEVYFMAAGLPLKMKG
ncbi:bifunctional adenosylcobinamide kinase/adenosylcobinamide-phosphate guanylyltransferase, partial [Brucella abortus]|nr:bifunctional adenosylcobinamide kinase/adenosylcobinamide-phosphate guanylyltransferase [Brucella abortus]